MVSIVVLNWNGKEFLKKCLSSVAKAVDIYRNTCEVIVIDNGSFDDSVEYIKKNFPQIHIIALRENFGFATAMNIGMKEARFPIVIGLNNDIIVDECFIAPLINHFSNGGDIFAVASKMLLWDKKTLNFGRAIGTFRFGLFRRRLVDSQTPVNTLYACGGGFAVDRKKFLELGGFDEDMIAFWEDADLCYRAWKHGWKTVYEPRSIIYHKFHGSYSKKCSENDIRRISGENYFLFMLKNIHDRVFFYQQLFLLPFLMLASIVVGKTHFAVGLMNSIKKWPLFFKKRHMEKERATLSDRQVFRISSQ